MRLSTDVCITVKHCEIRRAEAAFQSLDLDESGIAGDLRIIVRIANRIPYLRGRLSHG